MTRQRAMMGGCVLLVVMCCARCAAPVRDLPQAAGAVTVEGAHGRLSPAQGAAVVSAAVARSPDPEAAADLVALMESLGSEPLYKDNDVRLLIDGPATYRAMLAAIRSAHRSIRLETYIFSDDEVGRQFARMLMQKAAGGVEVSLLYDGIGSMDASAGFFDELRQAGVEVVAFHPSNPFKGGNPLEINNRDHRKLLIVDDEYAFTGGVNIDRNYSSGSGGRSRPDGQKGWRDTHIEVRGPAVEGFELLFLANWQRAGGNPETVATKPHAAGRSMGKALVRVLAAVGGEDKVSSIRIAYELAISKSAARVWITQPYFSPDPALLQSLEAAAARGVDVRIILPGVSDSRIVLNSSRYRYGELLRAGVRVYEMQGTMVHAKTAVIDGVWSTVGSSNLDYRSFIHNDEVNAVILDGPFAQALEDRFHADLEATREITLAEWEDRPYMDRITQFWSNAVEYLL